MKTIHAAGSVSAVRPQPLRSLVFFFVAAVLAVTAVPAFAQSFNVLHTFTGHDGQNPNWGMTMDRNGNLYGVTSSGENGYGTVFKLSKKNGNWIMSTLYTFQGGSDGWDPEGRVTIGPDGTLYGTTRSGGDTTNCYGQGCGTVFLLRPQPSLCVAVNCPWVETILHRFTGADGLEPTGDIVLDAQGNIYGSAKNIYKMTRSGQSWSFSQLSNSVYSEAGLVADAAGNLYGTTQNTIFEFSITAQGWQQTILRNLDNNNDGYVAGGLVFDSAGDLYGGNFDGGPNGGGTVFQLVPAGNGSWTYNVIYAFTGPGFGGPFFATFALDSAGSVYGTTLYGGAYNVGQIFKLSPSNGDWTLTDLHDFHPLGSDGCYPDGAVILDAGGNLYGTTEVCGSGNPGYGVVWEVSQN